jgi:hypothetical protein
MEKISNNLYRGELITNIMDIHRLAIEGKSIYCNNPWGIRPAAILINFPLIVIVHAINNNQLYFTHK